jgi:hypothetical protein
MKFKNATRVTKAQFKGFFEAESSKPKSPPPIRTPV